MRCLLSVGLMPLGTGITGPRSLTSNDGSSHGGKSSPLVSPGAASCASTHTRHDGQMNNKYCPDRMQTSGRLSGFNFLLQNSFWIGVCKF